MVKRTYEEVRKIFEEQGCILLTPETKYNEMKKVSLSKFQFTAKCGHENEVFLTNFLCKKSGLLCKNCTKEKLVNDFKQKDIPIEYCFYIESEAYCYLSSILSEEFDVRKTNEGCLADFIIKPKSVEEDKWLCIQLKSTKNICHNLYTFKINQKEYTDCVVLCICIGTKEVWLFDWKDVKVKKSLNIGLTDKSIFSKNKQTSVKDLIYNLHTYYSNYPKFTAEQALLPQNVYQQREQNFRRYREEKVNYLDYKYPLVEGLKYDFMINNYKIQEKVAGIRKDRKNVHLAFIYTSKGKVNKKQTFRSYSKGDNDFYWIWLDNKLEEFYIFPESVFIEKNIVDRKEGGKPILNIGSHNWTKNYKYTLEDKEKLLEMFK